MAEFMETVFCGCCHGQNIL